MIYNKIVNLPTANVAYLIRTLLVAIDPDAPVTLASWSIDPHDGNTGALAIGDSAMTSVDDGKRLEVGESHSGDTSVGIVLDTSGTYLIGSANNTKALIQGQNY